MTNFRNDLKRKESIKLKFIDFNENKFEKASHYFLLIIFVLFLKIIFIIRISCNSMFGGNLDSYQFSLLCECGFLL